MTLVEYIEQEGDKACAALWGFKERTVASWRRRERTPRKQQAKIIVANSPVTYAGIYELPDEVAA